jgi:hypothetical protein
MKRDKEYLTKVFKGFLLVLGTTLLVGLIIFVLSRLPGMVGLLVLLLLIGFIQWIYIIPLALSFRFRKNPAMAQGVLLGAALILLLNFAVCANGFGLFGSNSGVFF